MTRTVLLVMGVAGAGKSTLARALAARLGWPVLEADALHPAANVGKMRRGEPLTDADRAPWLAAVGEAMDRWAAEDLSGVVACSALKRAYRQTLRAGGRPVRLVYPVIDEALAHARVASRAGHYYPASLVASQFADLQPPSPDEYAITVDATAPTADQVAAVIAALAP